MIRVAEKQNEEEYFNFSGLSPVIRARRYQCIGPSTEETRVILTRGALDRD